MKGLAARQAAGLADCQSACRTTIHAFVCWRESAAAASRLRRARGPQTPARLLRVGLQRRGAYSSIPSSLLGDWPIRSSDRIRRSHNANRQVAAQVNEVNLAMNRSMHIRAGAAGNNSAAAELKVFSALILAPQPKRAAALRRPSLRRAFFVCADGRRAFHGQFAAAAETRGVSREQTDRRLAGSGRGEMLATLARARAKLIASGA